MSRSRKHLSVTWGESLALRWPHLPSPDPAPPPTPHSPTNPPELDDPRVSHTGRSWNYSLNSRLSPAHSPSPGSLSYSARRQENPRGQRPFHPRRPFIPRHTLQHPGHLSQGPGRAPLSSVQTRHPTEGPAGITRVKLSHVQPASLTGAITSWVLAPHPARGTRSPSGPAGDADSKAEGDAGA